MQDVLTAAGGVAVYVAALLVARWALAYDDGKDVGQGWANPHDVWTYRGMAGVAYRRGLQVGENR